MSFADFAATAKWQDTAISREFELRLGPTQPAGAGFAMEGALVVRGQPRFATIAEATPHLDAIARQEAQARLKSIVATAYRAVYVTTARITLDEAALRFAIESGDPPHPASDAQLRLRLERMLGSWLREHWIRKQ